MQDNIFKSLYAEDPPENCKFEMNTNFTSWKLLQKKLTDFIKKDGQQELG
jgi:hypothetical protein